MGRKDKHIAIVGAGLVGSLAALYLARRGYTVEVFERRPDMRKHSMDGGRSINLALSNRGWRPLKEVGIEEDVKKMVIPMKGRMMHNESKELTFQPYGREGEAINSISRGGLNELLMNKAEAADVQFYFNRRCVEVDYEKNRLTFEIDGRIDTFQPDIIIGADGAFSAVRTALQKTDRFNYSQHYIEHGYKELTIPPHNDGSHRLDKNALHIWPRGSYMLIALPNLDGSFTVTLFLGYEGSPSFNALQNDEDVVSFFRRYFPDAYALMPDLIDDWHHNPTSSLVTIRCFPWVKNNILLMGDASHAIVPFYGQGMNSGFEDCRVLNDLLEKHQDRWEDMMPEFERLRKPDADAISDLALQNFIEMRDLVADEMFLLRKKIEARLHDQFPNKWIPQYSMVTFYEDVRYSEALKIGNQQRQIMDEVMKRPDIKSSWETLDLETIVGKLA